MTLLTFAYMDLQFIAFMDFECSHVFSVLVNTIDYRVSWRVRECR